MSLRMPNTTCPMRDSLLRKASKLMAATLGWPYNFIVLSGIVFFFQHVADHLACDPAITVAKICKLIRNM